MTLRKEAERQGYVSADSFYNREVKRLTHQMPSVIRRHKREAEAARLHRIAKRKEKMAAKKAEALRMAAEKDAKIQAAAAALFAANKPATPAGETPEETQARVEDEAARALQRVGLGFLGRKRFNEKKEAMGSRPNSKTRKKKR